MKEARTCAARELVPPDVRRFDFRGESSACAGKIPKPHNVGGLLLELNIHCIPRQMPRIGFAWESAAWIAVFNPRDCNASVAAKWPTPGTTILSARKMTLCVVGDLCCSPQSFEGLSYGCQVASAVVDDRNPRQDRLSCSG